MALPIARVAVAVIRWLAKDADRARFLVPPHHAIVWNVAPDQVTSVTEPNRPFAPAHSGGNPFHFRRRDAVFVKTRINGFYGRVRITLARLPVGENGRDDGERSQCAAGSEKFSSVHVRDGLI